MMTLCDVAVERLNEGFKIVPLRPGEKIPALPNWPEAAFSTEAEVRLYWSQIPDANVGVLCTAYQFVLDVDTKNGGNESLEKLEAENGKLPYTRLVRTPSGGRHYYYRSDIPLSNSSGKIASGVDVRARGGQVVAPGGVHPKFPERYKLEWDLPIAKAPAWLIEAAGGKSIVVAPKNIHNLEGTVGEGKRNDTLFKAAAALRNQGLDEAGIYAAIAQLNQTKCEPPLPDSEVQLIAKSAMKYTPSERPITSKAVKEVPELVTRMTGEFMADTTVKQRDPLLFIGDSKLPLITTHSLNEIYAWRGTGKTNFMIALANCFASGQPWLYFKPARAVKVLFIEGEMPEAALQSRMRQQNIANFPFACVDFQPEKKILSFFEGIGRQMVENLIENLQPQVLIFDSISSLFGFETNEEANWTVVNDWFILLRNQGIALFFTHHAGKSGDQRGHSKSQDPLDVSMKLERPKDVDNTYMVADLHYDKLRETVPDAKDIRIELRRSITGGPSVWDFKNIDELKRESALKLLVLGRTVRQVSEEVGLSATTVAKYKREYDATVRTES